ncbi:snare associated Golgi protein-domain-containing protein [Polychytrium aggregatum]|uniref:snare associated Golgi protein-domain-containing protein n=1 Tax=Polychytrium aggregatum TaxID=110093 RepID=UPI0022FEF361|nr:snare associated Golgi protein-domain-containing protein [Polychytrium aggregatum]KAI9206750.1 snare associated Golgi protein-domain-containing protein [Polychytrium aggregatum]
MPQRNAVVGARNALWATAAAAIFLALGVIGYSHQEQIKAMWHGLMLWIQNHTIEGSVVYIVLFALACCVLVPASLVTLLAGFLFRPLWVSLLIVLAGSQLCLLVSYLLGQSLFRPVIEEWIHGSHYSVLDQAISIEGFKLVVLFRLSPIMPFGITNYLLSLTQIPYHTLAAATLVGNVPGAVTFSFLGSVMSDISGAGDYEMDRRSRLMTALLSLDFMVITVVYISLISQRALRLASYNPVPSSETAQDSDPEENQIIVEDEDDAANAADTDDTLTPSGIIPSRRRTSGGDLPPRLCEDESAANAESSALDGSGEAAVAASGPPSHDFNASEKRVLYMTVGALVGISVVGFPLIWLFA